jgi:plastocyanin
MILSPLSPYPTLMRSVLLLAVVCGAVLVSVAASSGSPGRQPPSQATAAAQGAPVKVRMRRNKFRPRRVVVRLGRRVRWTNRDRYAHTVTSDRLGINKVVRGRKTFTFRPLKRGRFAYFCLIHANQTGVLIVR